MARFTVGGSYGVDTTLLDISNLWSGTITAATADTISVWTGSTTVDFRGSFSYSDGTLAGGTLTSFAERLGSTTLYTVDQFSMSATAFVGYVQRGDTAGAKDAIFGGNDTLTGSPYGDRLEGRAGNDRLTGGAGSDFLWGGAGVDTAVFSGARSAFTISPGSLVGVTRNIADIDILRDMELAEFDDRTILLTSSFTAGQAVGDYFSALRDYGGGDMGSAAGWVYQGQADVNSDGRTEHILTNAQNGRWATASMDASGFVDFSEHGAGGTTRVVGIYMDPLVASGAAELGGPFDSQTRFGNDLRADRLRVLGAADYDGDGATELYWRVADGNADATDDVFLRAIMHADGNIHYANYQNRAQMTAHMTTNGVGSAAWAGW